MRLVPIGGGDTMELGICWASKVDDLDYVVLAESLGYSHLWAADSQMIWSDCYAALALAARDTTTMRLGTGVAVAGTRPSAVTAAAHATINRLAPGRVFCGIGTGNTAMRIMGHKPITMREFDRHLAELRALLDGQETDVEWRGTVAPTRHLMPDSGFVAFEPRIPLYVSAFGPKAMAIAARRGDGLVMSVPPIPDAVQCVWKRLHAAAGEVGRTLSPDTFLTTTLTTAVVLEPGETTASRRVADLCGAFAVSALHYAYEQARQLGRRPPEYDADLWAEYVAMLEEVPEERRHLRIHRGHNCWVEPEEERFVTPELIERTCLVGTASALAARIDALHDAGLRQLVLLPPLACKEQVLRDVAEQVMPLLSRR